MVAVWQQVYLGNRALTFDNRSHLRRQKLQHPVHKATPANLVAWQHLTLQQHYVDALAGQVMCSAGSTRAAPYYGHFTSLG